eukprot:Lankesteria_metandrocarpae@DN5067_c0_g1_i1.p1
MSKRVLHSDALNGNSSVQGVSSHVLNENGDFSENDDESKTEERQAVATHTGENPSSESQVESLSVLGEDNHDLTDPAPPAASANRVFEVVSNQTTSPKIQQNLQNPQQNCKSSPVMSNQLSQQSMPLINNQQQHLYHRLSPLQPPLSHTQPPRQSSSATTSVSAGTAAAPSISAADSHNKNAPTPIPAMFRTGTTNIGTPANLSAADSTSRSPVKSLLQARISGAKLGTCPLWASSAEQFFSNGAQEDQGSSHGFDAQRGAYQSGHKCEGVPVGFEDMGRVEDGSLLVVSSLSAERKIYFRASGRWLEDKAMFAQEEIWSTGHLFRQGAVDEIQRRFRDFVELRKPVLSGIQSRNLSSTSQPRHHQSLSTGGSVYQRRPPPAFSGLPTATMTEHFLPTAVPPLSPSGNSQRDNSPTSHGSSSNNSLLFTQPSTHTSNNIHDNPTQNNNMLSPRGMRHVPITSSLLSPIALPVALQKQPPTAVFPSPLPFPTLHHKPHAGTSTLPYQVSSSKSGTAVVGGSLGLLQQLQPTFDVNKQPVRQSGMMPSANMKSPHPTTAAVLPLSEHGGSLAGFEPSLHVNGNASTQLPSSGRVMNYRSRVLSPSEHSATTTQHSLDVAAIVSDAAIAAVRDHTANTANHSMLMPTSNPNAINKNSPAARGNESYYTPAALPRTYGKLPLVSAAGVNVDNIQSTLHHLSSQSHDQSCGATVSSSATSEPTSLIRSRSRLSVIDRMASPRISGTARLASQLPLDNANGVTAYDTGAAIDGRATGGLSGIPNRSSSGPCGRSDGHQQRALQSLAFDTPGEAVRRLIADSANNDCLLVQPNSGTNFSSSNNNTTSRTRATADSNNFNSIDSNKYSFNNGTLNSGDSKGFLRTGAEDKSQMDTDLLKGGNGNGLPGTVTGSRAEDELNALLSSTGMNSKDKGNGTGTVPNLGPEDFQELASWIGQLLVSAAQEKQGDSPDDCNSAALHNSDGTDYSTAAEDAVNQRSPQSACTNSGYTRTATGGHEDSTMSSEGVYRDAVLAGTPSMPISLPSTPSQHQRQALPENGSHLPPLQLVSLRAGQLQQQQQFANAANTNEAAERRVSASAGGEAFGGRDSPHALTVEPLSGLHNGSREVMDLPRTSTALDLQGDRHAVPSDMKGVNYISASKTWRASFYFSGKLKSKSFSVRKYGHEAAKQLAIVCRQSMEVPESKAQLNLNTPPYGSICSRSSATGGGALSTPPTSISSHHASPDIMMQRRDEVESNFKGESNNSSDVCGMLSPSRPATLVHHSHSYPRAATATPQNNYHCYSSSTGTTSLSHYTANLPTQQLQRGLHNHRNTLTSSIAGRILPERGSGSVLYPSSQQSKTDLLPYDIGGFSSASSRNFTAVDSVTAAGTGNRFSAADFNAAKSLLENTRLAAGASAVVSATAATGYFPIPTPSFANSGMSSSSVNMSSVGGDVESDLSVVRGHTKDGLSMKDNLLALNGSSSSPSLHVPAADMSSTLPCTIVSGEDAGSHNTDSDVHDGDDTDSLSSNAGGSKSCSVVGHEGESSTSVAEASPHVICDKLALIDDDGIVESEDVGSVSNDSQRDADAISTNSSVVAGDATNAQKRVSVKIEENVSPVSIGGRSTSTRCQRRSQECGQYNGDAAESVVGSGTANKRRRT